MEHGKSAIFHGESVYGWSQKEHRGNTAPQEVDQDQIEEPLLSHFLCPLVFETITPDSEGVNARNLGVRREAVGLFVRTRTLG